MTNPATAYDWKREGSEKKAKGRKKEVGEVGLEPLEVQFFDDGTITFFWYLFYLLQSFKAINVRYFFPSVGELIHCQSCS